MISISSVTNTVDQIVVNRVIIIIEFENEGYTVTRLSVDVMTLSFEDFSAIDDGVAGFFGIVRTPAAFGQENTVRIGNINLELEGQDNSLCFFSGGGNRKESYIPEDKGSSGRKEKRRSKVGTASGRVIEA